MKPPSESQVRAFRAKIRRYFRLHGRDLPWRNTRDPYAILVSEIMLQQTQVERVSPKYEAFLRSFPSFEALHRAPLQKVLASWSGLGYNRRALALKNCAGLVVTAHQGKLPCDEAELRALPGIGAYTAAALCAFVFAKPTVFIETNIRTVFIHEFFHNHKSVHDEDLKKLIRVTLPSTKIREWYYGLMDYGSALKRQGVRTGPQSLHYRRQSPFKGSRRELRGAVLRRLLNSGPCRESDFLALFHERKDDIAPILAALAREGLIAKRRSQWHIINI